MTSVAMRMWLHSMDDQNRARAIWGRSIVTLAAACWCGNVIWYIVHPPEPSVAHIVAMRAVLYGIIPIYNRLATMPNADCLAFVCFGILFCLSCPPYSELGAI